jgi:hypothetical protein
MLLWTQVYKYLKSLLSVVLDYICRRGMLDHMLILFFNFWRKCHTGFPCCIHHFIFLSTLQKDCLLHSLLTLVNFWFFLVVFFFPVVVCFVKLGILMCFRWYIIVIWALISLVTSNIEHLFMGLLAICKSSLEKSLFKSFTLF